MESHFAVSCSSRSFAYQVNRPGDPGFPKVDPVGDLLVFNFVRDENPAQILSASVVAIPSLFLSGVHPVIRHARHVVID